MKNGMRKVAKEEVRKHEKSMHGVKKMSSGGMCKMNMERKKVGRNMAKVMNQRGR
jgi:hypothetical protein